MRNLIMQGLTAGSVIGSNWHPQTFAQFPAQNVTLRSQVLPAQVGATRGSSCWGYTSPSGRQYALMGYNTCMSVIEVTNPDSPVIVNSIPHSTSPWCEVKTYGHFAYVTNESSGGLDVVDLSQVDNGVVTLTQRLTTDGLSRAHTVSVDEVSGFLYLNGANLFGGRLIAYSLSDPANPVRVGQVSNPPGAYVHDSQVVTYDSGPYSGRQIAFCCEINSRRLAIYDVTDKSAMVQLSAVTYPDARLTHQGWLSADRRYFYLEDESPPPPRQPTRVFDVSDLSAPVLVSTFGSDRVYNSHNLFIRDHFLFESNYSRGLEIFDTLVDPLNPPRTGTFDTDPGSESPGYRGSWGNYPFFGDRNVILSDMQSGMFVVDVTRATNYLLFTFPNGLPNVVAPDAPARFRVRITERRTPMAAGSARLHYDLGAGIINVPLVEVGPLEFDAELPPAPCGTSIAFYLSAENSFGDQYFSALDAPATTHIARVGRGFQLHLNQDFQVNNPPWTSGAAGDTATSGQWVLARPIGTSAAPAFDHTPEPGAFCWVTGNATGDIGVADVDGGTTTLLSHFFDVSGFDNAVLSYWRWYSNNQGGAPYADVFRVDISADGGTGWTNVEVLGPTGEEVEGGWRLHEFSIGEFVPLTNQMRLRFVADDAGDPSIIEAAIDDFQIREVSCAPGRCPTDLNHDGIVDLSDLALLLSNFGCLGLNCTGDVDADADTDLADLAVLLSAFATTCD